MSLGGWGERVRGDALGQRVRRNVTTTTAAPLSAHPRRPRGREEHGAEPNYPERRKKGPVARRLTEGWSLQSLHHRDPSTTLYRPLGPPVRRSLSEPLAVPFLANADPDPSRLPSHPTRRLPHQAVLCPPPQESKCSTFPAKTGWRHTVANARALAVK